MYWLAWKSGFHVKRMYIAQPAPGSSGLIPREVEEIDVQLRSGRCPGWGASSSPTPHHREDRSGSDERDNHDGGNDEQCASHPTRSMNSRSRITRRPRAGRSEPRRDRSPAPRRNSCARLPARPRGRPRNPLMEDARGARRRRSVVLADDDERGRCRLGQIPRVVEVAVAVAGKEPQEPQGSRSCPRSSREVAYLRNQRASAHA